MSEFYLTEDGFAQRGFPDSKVERIWSDGGSDTMNEYNGF